MDNLKGQRQLARLDASLATPLNMIQWRFQQSVRVVFHKHDQIHKNDTDENTTQQTKFQNKINQDAIQHSMEMLDIDHLGLEPIDRQILSIIIDDFEGGPTGLKSLAASTGEEIETIQDVHEPYLIQTGLLRRTPRGRVATKKAYQHLDIKPPDTLPL